MSSDAKIKVRLEEVRELMSDDESFSSTQSPATASLQHSSASLNPHKAFMMQQPVPVEEKHSQVLSTETVQAIRGVVGRDRIKLSQAVLRKRSSEGESLSMPDMDTYSGRQRASSSASERKKRSTHVADSFQELERLLHLKGENKSRAELVEESVDYIKELQHLVNDAGEKNSELHDRVESMQSRQARYARGRTTREAELALEILKSIRNITYTDACFMMTAGVLANMAPADWQETLKEGSGAITITLRGVVKHLARFLVAASLAVFVFRLIKRSKMLMVVRWGIYSLLAEKPVTPTPPGRTTSLTSSSSSAYTQRAYVAPPNPSLRKIYSAEDMDSLPSVHGGYRARATSNPVLSHPARIISPHR